MLPRVYRIEGSPLTWVQRLAAVALWAERGFAFSHRTAAALWGFARYREGGEPHVSVTRNVRTRALRVHQVSSLQARDLGNAGGWRVTSQTRTIVDLCEGEDERDVRASLDEALRRRWTTVEHLERAADRAEHRRGVVLLRTLLRHYQAGEAPTESELEARVFELLSDEGLPRPTKQRSVIAGVRTRRLDFHFPGTPVVIEADGYAFHSSLEMFERDRERHNALAARGLRVLHWSWAALRDRPEELIAQLKSLLARD